ncbi:hypothetical protein JOC86_000088 [Bacillus pakistanensis]|uniref:Uncharacterized protein n=1 Tax=Rossellomorea pakistanensis TaxID=992288 RepID=A0ABS2N6R0_9BACI|nr:YxiJ family protein [Bacillus pakistanensis]MBM7583551.1 hypothetical protein [Bacillus pakistanensis]
MIGIDPIKNVRSVKFTTGMNSYFNDVLQLVIKEKHPRIIGLLSYSYSVMKSPFPYEDTGKMKEDFKSSFSVEDLNGDLNTYWMSILASLTLIGKTTKMPCRRLEWLKHSFFDHFKQYLVLDKHIEKYPHFYEQYMAYENIRLLVLYFLNCY